jgi:hypothetical protein
VPEVIRESTDSIETVLTTFYAEGRISCMPNLVQWGIDMADPVGVDTPQGNGYFRIESESRIAVNMPSPPYAAHGANYTPPQVMIEFDPPVRSVEFYYSRLANARAIWRGQIVGADSMQVEGVSRTPGTTSYQTWARKVLYSNVAHATIPYDTWTYAKLATTSGDKIQWLWFDGTLMIDDLKITRVKPDTTFKISLACTPTTVIRANTVSCNASWTPTTITAGEILFEWQFQGDPVRVFPAANAMPYDPPPPIDSVGQGMSTWLGKMVLGGRVSLRATWQSEVETATANILVNPRTSPSFGDLPVSFSPVMGDIPTDSTKTLVNQPNPDGIGSPGVAGQNYDVQTSSGLIQDVINGSPSVTSVTSGPNRGLWYVVTPGVQSTRGARIRTWLRGLEQPEFSYKLSSGLLTNRGLLQARRKTLKSKLPMHPDSTVFLNGVWAHETYGQSGAKGHQGQIELAKSSLPTCGKVPAIVERLVAADSGTALFRAFDVLGEGKLSLYAASWHDHVYGNYSNAPAYEVVPQVTVADNLNWLTIRGDVQAPAEPSMAPDPRWNCSRVY